jgi:hypothetical protein
MVARGAAVIFRDPEYQAPPPLSPSPLVASVESMFQTTSVWLPRHRLSVFAVAILGLASLWLFAILPTTVRVCRNSLGELNMSLGSMHFDSQGAKL